jgi:gliding-associated putative ABC transporter substrate-binding component GldG
MTERARLLLDSRLQMALVVLIVVLANTAAARHFFRVDLSRDRLYSLDESSKRIAGRLDKPLVVKVYFTPGLEAPYHNHEQFIRDKLEEYRAYAGGRIQIQLVDPDMVPEAAEEARKYGITQLEYTVRAQDRAELRKIWMGAVLLYGGRQEVLPALTNLGSLEYDLSSALYRLQQKADDRRTIAWSTGHGEPDYLQDQGPLRSLAENLARKFTLKQVVLGGAGTIPEDVDALVIVGPQQPLEDRALYQVDQFLMHGGSVGFFITNTRPDMRSMRVTHAFSGLDPLLGHYGVQVNRDVVLDRVSNSPMRFPVRSGGKIAYRDINHPLIPKATDLSKTSVMVSGLDALVLPFASSITPTAEPAAGVTYEAVARSGDASGAVASVKSLDPAQLREVFPDEKRGPFPMVVTATGAFRSFFETRPAPAPVGGIAPVTEDAEEGAFIAEGSPTRLVVTGSADMIANNPAFMLNLCDWLVQEEALIGIRSKIATLPGLSPTSAREQLAWKLGMLGWGPLVLLGYGAWRSLRYRRRARGAA